MAEKPKKVTNQAEINAAQAANKLAQENAAAAQARAEAANEARKPILRTAVAGAGALSAALKASLDAIQSNAKQSQIDKLYNQTKAAADAAKASIASITPEQRQFAIDQGNIYTSSMSDVQKYNAMISPVPEAVYATEPDVRTTNITVLKALLKGQGFNAALIDSSATYLQKLLVEENLDYDNAVEVFLNSKEYSFADGTTLTSPFYTAYGYLNEGLTNPKSARELYGAVEGYKGVVETYKLSNKYLSTDSLKGYVKNNVTVADLAERANMSAIRSLETDPFQVEALRKQGFIGTSANLIDFYMDEKIGKEQLELNRQTGVFTAEALRREKAGVVTSEAQLAGFKQLTATLAAKGYSEAQISQLAATGFENISQVIDPLTKYAGIYEKAGGTQASNEALKSGIQNSLLGEEFLGTESERRKRLAEQNQRAFQGVSGTTTTSLRTPGVSGLI
jgi:hypothetical protein